MKRLFQTSAPAGRWPAFGGLALAALCLAPLLSSACGEDARSADPAGAGGSGDPDGGMAGSADSGLAGNAGRGGDATEVRITGSVRVLSDNARQLLGPTAAALRGQNVWIANGQLRGLFGGAAPRLPFSAVSVPLAGGTVAATDVRLTGNTFYPEGIAAAADGTLYIGSIGQSTIVRVPVNSTTPQEFLAGGVAETAVIGIAVDDERDLVWFCDSDPTDLPRTGAVVGVGIEDGEEVVRHVLAADGEASLSCNDLLVDPAGNLWITESSAGLLYRIDAASALMSDSAQLWMNGGLAAAPEGGFGANGLALAGDVLIVSNTGTGALFAVETVSTNPVSDARPIALFEGNTGSVQLCGPDGLIAVPGADDEIVVVESGDCAAGRPRVVRIALRLRVRRPAGG
ncbi:MAG: hypothetical protein RL685_5529 [Pseudomonadota bacterium]|jgi:sugar lactone lactonase YvrE